MKIRWSAPVLCLVLVVLVLGLPESVDASICEMSDRSACPVYEGDPIGGFGVVDAEKFLSSGSAADIEILGVVSPIGAVWLPHNHSGMEVLEICAFPRYSKSTEHRIRFVNIADMLRGELK